MLGGFVFLSHQVGSFLGVWLGGRLYDATGSYDVVWWIAVASAVRGRSSTCRSASGRSCARRWHEAGTRSRAWSAAALAWPRCSRATSGPTSPSTSPTRSGPASDGSPPGRAMTPQRDRHRRPGSSAGRTSSRRAAACSTSPAGSGRHARWLAARGHAVTAVDRDAAAMAPLRGIAEVDRRRHRGRALAARRPPLRRASSSRTTSGARCCRRSTASLATGGVLLYETFAAGNETVGRPSRPDFLLRPGELLEAARGSAHRGLRRRLPGEPRPLRAAPRGRARAAPAPSPRRYSADARSAPAPGR